MHAVAEPPLADDSVPTLERVRRLESEMKALPPAMLADIDALTRHNFAPGVYAREMFLPAGMCVVGKMHAREHFMVMFGDASVWTDEGVKRLQGFHLIRTMPGTKRVGYAHADTIFVTFHHNPTDTQDLEVIEAEHIVPQALECERAKELIQ